MAAEIEHGQNGLAFKEIERLVSLAGYRSFTLRLAILRPDRFVTGCMIFDTQEAKDGQVEVFEYSEAILASFTAGVEMWSDFARRLTSNNLEVNGTRVSAMLAYGTRRKDSYLGVEPSQPRECFLFSEATTGSLYSQTPLLGIKKPAYVNVADASARYVHRLRADYSQIQFERTLVIALPVRPRIQLAEWLPGELRMQLIEELPDYQADFFFCRGSRVIDTKSIAGPSRDSKLDVPSGTTTIVGHLLSPSGEIAQSFALHAPYSYVGDALSSLSREQQVRADISAGESDNREMKAFFNPTDNTEMRDRVLHSSIAFANTSGGRIYVGVEDNGDLSGNSKLTRAMRNGRTPSEAAQELTAKLRRLIVEGTRPVLEVTADAILLDSEWVVSLEIQQSHLIVATHTNDIFVRMGASNRRPSADWLDARSARNSAAIAAFES